MALNITTLSGMQAQADCILTIHNVRANPVRSRADAPLDCLW